MASLLSLPDGILLMIFGNLYHVGHSSHQQSPKKDVLSSRLVCRRMAGIGQELAFEHIDFLQDEKGIKRLLELSKSPLCRLVKRLSCYFEALDSRRASSVDAFRTWLRLDAFRTLEEVQEMFEAYCRESQYQCLLNRIGLDVAIPLGQFQSLRAVEMGVWRSRWYDAMSDDEFDRLCASSTGHRFLKPSRVLSPGPATTSKTLLLGTFTGIHPAHPTLRRSVLFRGLILHIRYTYRLSEGLGD